VIAALNLFLAMFFATALLVAYFYLPKVANGADLSMLHPSNGQPNKASDGME